MNWPRLTPAAHTEGYVLFGVSRPDTLVGVTRVAVLLSHYYQARPLAIHVALGDEPTWEGRVDLEGERLFALARAEAAELGYPLHSYSEFARDAAAGIRQVAKARRPRAVVLGRSFGRGAPGFARAADSLGDGGGWPIVVIRFPDPDRFDRVRVVLTDRTELARLQPILQVLSETCGLPTSFLLLAEGEEGKIDPERERAAVEDAVGDLGLQGVAAFRAVSEKHTLPSILDTMAQEELMVMHLGDCRSSGETLACRVAEDLAPRTNLPLLLVRGDLRAEASA